MLYIYLYLSIIYALYLSLSLSLSLSIYLVYLSCFSSLVRFIFSTFNEFNFLPDLLCSRPVLCTLYNPLWYNTGDYGIFEKGKNSQSKSDQDSQLKSRLIQNYHISISVLSLYLFFVRIAIKSRSISIHRSRFSPTRKNYFQK